MTPRLSYTNIAIVGLTQVATVVAAVLAAGAAFKMWSGSGLAHDPEVAFACEYGFLFLAVPLTWITAAMVVQGRDESSDYPELATFLSGILILVLLLIAAWRVGVSPWIRIGGCGMTLSS